MFGNSKYSRKWFKNASDEELSDERETLRQEFCQGNISVEPLLSKFDDEQIDRMNKKYREEHGMKQIDKRTWVDKNGNKYTDCEWI